MSKLVTIDGVTRMQLSDWITLFRECSTNSGKVLSRGVQKEDRSHFGSLDHLMEEEYGSNWHSLFGRSNSWRTGFVHGFEYISESDRMLLGLPVQLEIPVELRDSDYSEGFDLSKKAANALLFC